MTIKKSVTPASLAAQAMGWIDPVTKAVVPPIHMASTYQRDEDNAYRSGRIYARADNPTFDQAEETLAALEGGAKALIFSSGMSAATACFLALAPGDHVVAPKVMYWSLRNWLGNFATHWGLKVEFVDADNTDAIAAAVKPGATKLVWLETPANPTWSLTDIAAAVAPHISIKRGAKITAASAAHEFLFRQELELSIKRRPYLGRRRKGAYCDPKTEATRLEFNKPTFDSRPARKRLKARRIKAQGD